jgi:pimeloyl-ACP methyl ester carboxylesterase
MKLVFLILSWFVSVGFALLTVSMLLTKNWLQGIALLIVFLLLLPPARTLAFHLTGRSIPWWGRLMVVAVLLAAFVWMGLLTSYTAAIYKSPEVRARFLKMYDAKMKSWPVPFEDVYIDTEYGKVHVVACGPEDAPPFLLLHASGVSSWSWLSNVKALSRHYRIYAVDTLGDAGKSELLKRDHYPSNGRAQAGLCAVICNSLGIERAFVAGASEGGFIGTNFALYAPERVEKLVLLGPMGYGGTAGSVFRIMLAQLFPLKGVQKRTIAWAFGDNPGVAGMFSEWFPLLMTETFPRKARPVQFTANELRSLQVPVLLILGSRDNLLGDPEKSGALARVIPGVRVEVLDSGHLIGVEQPKRVNNLLLKFLGKP